MWYTVFDIETTGLDTFRDEIVQFGYVILNEEGEKLRSDCLYFYKDGLVMPDDAYQIHGISAEFLSQYKDDFIPNLIKMAVSVNRAYTVTYNGDRFDVPFLQNYLSRNLISNTVILGNYDVMKLMNHRKKLVDTVKILGITDKELESNHEKWFGKTEGKAHDACYDVTMTATCFLKIINSNKDYNKSADYIEVKKTPEMRLVKASFSGIDFIVSLDSYPFMIPMSEIDSVLKYGIYDNYSFDLDVIDDIRYTSELDTMFVDGVGPAGLKLVLEDNVYKAIL